MEVKNTEREREREGNIDPLNLQEVTVWISLMDEPWERLTRFEYSWSLWFAKSDSSKGVDKWTLVANGKRVFSWHIYSC